MKPGGQILKDYQLRTTTSREAILGLFIRNGFALSYSDIEREIAASFDRVTVYRTLKTFLDKGVIHKVLDDEGSLKYALCSDPCSTHEHHHEHVHFKCEKCGQTNCLESVTIPPVALPKGFSVKEMNLLIQGKCNKCQ
ncbi:MAG: transcriptional repressor [Cyclobacteriaceae bacterium]|nr:MAG: transcriptional repressor [Cyclobacteriaceae bacterium]